MGDVKNILEINPSHPIIKEMLERVKQGETTDQETEELALMMTETALINSGFTLNNPHSFAKRFYKLFNGAIGIDKNAPIEEFELSPDDEDEEDSSSKTRDHSSEEGEASESDKQSDSNEEEQVRTSDDL